MEQIKLIKHHKGAPLLRMFGFGYKLTIFDGLSQLQKLLEENTFWAKGRNKKQICKMLSNSTVVVSVWHQDQLIGFGRATSDEVYRAVLWDIIINKEMQGNGLGRLVVDTLLKSPKIKNTEKIYLMTTNHIDFYKAIGFKTISNQNLMLLHNK